MTVMKRGVKVRKFFKNFSGSHFDVRAEEHPTSLTSIVANTVLDAMDLNRGQHPHAKAGGEWDLNNKKFICPGPETVRRCPAICVASPLASHSTYYHMMT